MEMREVYSSNVASIGYENGTLVVEWQRGKTSAYDGVPEDVAERVMNAPSIGQALSIDIIGHYDHRYV